MPEAVLPIVFLISLIILKIIRKKYYFALSARIAMAVMLIFTGIAHFVYTEGMALMIPKFLPLKTEAVYLTGILEIIISIALLIPKFEKITGWLLILFFILILPVNIYAAVNHVDMKTASYEGSGAGYLLYRIPLQIFFIAWTYFSCIKFPSK
ncbi:putative membrane protein [Chryseobacterium populi]|uniref:Putative membrane protein n=2 Tax=Chryseobacterium populi TaxID=1144316 RepID=J2T3X3_9FLAO|nr:putative membrane protein [Chryseobacterium populi]